MKTNRTLWTWLMDVFAPSPAPSASPRITQEPRKIIPLDTPQAFSIQELRWA